MHAIELITHFFFVNFNTQFVLGGGCLLTKWRYMLTRLFIFCATRVLGKVKVYMNGLQKRHTTHLNLNTHNKEITFFLNVILKDRSIAITGLVTELAFFAHQNFFITELKDSKNILSYH